MKPGDVLLTADGAVLSGMPLFLQPGAHVLVPLEATYQAAFAAVPARWRVVLEGLLLPLRSTKWTNGSSRSKRLISANVVWDSLSAIEVILSSFNAQPEAPATSGATGAGAYGWALNRVATKVAQSFP